MPATLPPQILHVAIYESETSRKKLASINTKASDIDLIKDEDWCTYSPVSFNPLVKHELRLEKLSSLPVDWDGYEAIPPYDDSISNCYKFISRMPREVVDLIDDQSLVASNYGTIVVDLLNVKGEKVSIEFGKTKLGFYSSFNDNQNWSLDSQPYNYNSIPSDLKNAITKLVKANLL